MNTYVTTDGRPVLCIAVPVTRTGGATDDPLPPIMIGTLPPVSATSSYGPFVVYEPYAVYPVPQGATL